MPGWLALSLGTMVGGLVGYAMSRHPDEDPFELGVAIERPPEGLADSPWLAEMLDACESGVLVVGIDDRVLAANTAMAKLFHTTAERMVGRAIIEATGFVELDRRVALARIGQGTGDEVEISASRQPRLVKLNVTPLRDGCILVLALDVTAARESERIRREFLGNIAHELRTPLAGVKLMVETLQSIDDQPTQLEFFPQIAAEIDRLVELVEHMLEAARAEGGRLEIHLEPVELHELLVLPLVGLEARVRERGVSLRRQLEPVSIMGDPGRLVQILVNLVENALRHTPSGGHITVRTGVRDDAAFLEVRDTGCGIPYRDLPHIFERFYVVDRSRAKARGGLGLGLAIVKGTVEAHGGHIEVDSELGAGSCFTVHLPRFNDEQGDVHDE